jgi:hypothetical protein
VTLQDRLPRCSPIEPRTQFRASTPERETSPDLHLTLVGVTGFEPTTSSSRSRPGSMILMHVWLCVLLRAWGGVGTRRSLEARIPRSSPHTAPAKDPGHRLPVEASRRASFARPGRACLVQVERLTSRTTWTRQARSGCLRCAMGCRGTGIPERRGSWGGAPAAGGPVRVVGPEALPAGGHPLVVACSNGRGTRPTAWRSRCALNVSHDCPQRVCGARVAEKDHNAPDPLRGCRAGCGCRRDGCRCLHRCCRLRGNLRRDASRPGPSR